MSNNNQPNLPNISTDPSQVATPGMNQEIQNVYTQGGQAQGQANNSALAALQRAGVAGGSESGNALGNIAGQTAGQEASALSGLQNQQFQQQSSLMDALNQVNLQNYQGQSQNNYNMGMLQNSTNQGYASLGGTALGSIIGAMA